MGNLKVFAENAEHYDQWFEKHYTIFLAELAAIQKAMPNHKRGIEIGVGSGRFAAPLGIKFGIDPVPEMLQKAAARGIEVQQGFAEYLLYPSNSFDYVLMTTTICFLNNIDQAFSEVARILQTDGIFTVAFIDKNSQLGQKYQKHKNNLFYANATFYSPDDIYTRLENAGFKVMETYQTLLPDSNDPFEYCSGHGKGAFVIINSKNNNKILPKLSKRS